jgi:FemAB-related protein (PEP-CTERM system-associated)
MTGTPPQAPTTVTIEEMQDAVLWDAFVETCPDASFFHRAGWKRVIEEAFGHRCHFLQATREDGDSRTIVGVLPLGHIRSRLFGNALISAPFAVYGGAAAVDSEAATALEQAACQLADELGVDYLELRHRRPRHPDWPTQDALYVTFRKTIDPDPEVNMKAIPRKQRAMVRKGIKAGLVGRVEDTVDRFYPVYAESVRNLGTPVYSQRYFRLLKEEFGPDCEVLTVEKDGVPAAAVMSFYFRDEVLPYYGGGTATSRFLKANDFMYWDLMRRAGERGIRVFDYGRSKRDTGSYRFKTHWGFEPETLYYEYYLVKATAMPELNPTNPKYRLFIDLWKRMPLKLSMWLGPFIVKNLG